ncbi:cytochrome b561 domain-containing protein 2-like [Belonocnema kinseyi]|uniref:cytochrome b561 domain-containing protein 2-like n=1 Tax=Belonocnema kinseyi TaxID=2817044 RepID=UPI00143DBE89|nr:cytochrome b561 domain-containing protein 2-like [Belonocnema kinseyi]
MDNQHHEGNDEGKNKSEWGPRKIFFASVNSINHVLILFLTAYILYLGWDLSKNTNIHAVFCTLGYVFLMSEAIILIAEENIWTNFFSRQTNKHLHWILQVGGSTLSIAGVAIKFNHKKEHFQSTHAITGIISVSFIILVALLGVFAFFAFRLRKMLRPVIFKFLHNFLGVFCFVIGMTSLLYGLEKRWMKNNATEGMAKTCIIFTYVITLFSLFGAIRSLFNQAGSIFFGVENSSRFRNVWHVGKSPS